jgi:glucuronate isomerase
VYRRCSDREKFDAWAATVPHTIGNPLYHWTHLELRRPFGITGKLLSPSTADEIWNQCNDLLAQERFSARGIMKQMNVKMVGTTDDPIDSLEHHAAVAKDTTFISKCCQAGARIKRSTLSRRPSTTTWRSWVKCPIPISPLCRPASRADQTSGSLRRARL